MSPYDPNYKQYLIDKILSGAYDYTYGPGSPRATPSDIRQVIGARNNPLSTGDLALPPKDYAMFTPAERDQYRIADTSWFNPTAGPTPRGSVERYFGATAGQVYPTPTGTPPPNMPAYVPPSGAGGNAAPGYLREGNPAQMSSFADYGSALQDQQNLNRGMGVISSGLANAGQQIASAGQQNMQLASNLTKQKSPFEAYLANLAQDPLAPMRQVTQPLF